MSKLEKLKDKAKGLEAKDPKGAIEAWLEVLQAQEEEGEPNPDLSVFNRIGDLYLKVKDPGQAADYYERAVDRYAELGFHNNAIAMCNKVLRNAPARQTTYLKLAKLYASKGFLAEAKQNFVEYAERMERVGKIQHAFAALKEFTDLSPESAGLREMLEEHLQMYGTPERRGSDRVSMPAAPKGPPESKDDLSKSEKRKTSSLVFLDLDEPSPKSKRPTGPSRPPERVASLLTEVTPDPDTSLEIETTSLAGESAHPAADGMIEGFERTVDFGEVQASAPSAPSLRDELSTGDIEHLAGLEPTMETDIEPVDVEPVEVEPEPLAELDIEDAPPPPPKGRVTAPKVAPPKFTPPPAQGAPPRVAPVVPKRPGAPPPRGTAPPMPKPPESPRVKPVVPKRPIPPPPAGQPPKRKMVVEVPPLELEPDFETEMTAAEHDADDPETNFIRTEDDTSIAPGRTSQFVDLGVDEVVQPGGQGGALDFANVEEAPAAGTIEELESRVADDPDDPDAHRALGEALIEAGERERGVQELDHATGGFENRGDLDQARGLVEEILRLDPNSVRHRQKQVEYAFKSGDKASLVDAYLELADTLLRSDLPDKARAVYQRVAEHDRSNERAQAALAMLAPAGSRAPAPKPKDKVKETRTAPRDAKLTVRDEAAELTSAEVAEGDFVDLGAIILEDDQPTRDTRMKVADEEPTGDEEKDFHDMLARFKQGIDENIDEADFQSHYDLGVAFKEMGLLDEAITEFQKALRAPEGKLKTSEALGACFLEKGALVVAESILRRGLDLPASGDQDRLGVLYWLGRALEGQGKKVEARELYGRVFAVEIRFRDVGERVKALAKAK